MNSCHTHTHTIWGPPVKKIYFTCLFKSTLLLSVGPHTCYLCAPPPPPPQIGIWGTQISNLGLPLIPSCKNTFCMSLEGICKIFFRNRINWGHLHNYLGSPKNNWNPHLLSGGPHIIYPTQLCRAPRYLSGAPDILSRSP